MKPCKVVKGGSLIWFELPVGLVGLRIKPGHYSGDRVVDKKAPRTERLKTRICSFLSEA